MTSLLQANERVADRLETIFGRALLPKLARFTFAATLLVCFWGSAMTKLGEGPQGLFSPSLGAYAQIFPRAMERAGFDAGQLATWQHLTVPAGTWTELLLPALVLIGLATRLAALGMIGIVIVQTATDLFGHGALGDQAVFGAWFDRTPDAPILDQRLLCIVLLLVPAVLGAGPLSVDGWLSRQARPVQAASG